MYALQKYKRTFRTMLWADLLTRTYWNHILMHSSQRKFLPMLYFPSSSYTMTDLGETLIIPLLPHKALEIGMSNTDLLG